MKRAPVLTPAAGAESTAPPGQVEFVRDLVQVVSNTVQAARLFPPEHQTVINFVSDLHSRLSTYLDEHGELEIGIEEHSLTFAGQPVYEDPVTAKSLPFFFFKDGMRALVFCRGLKREEIQGFLETIRQVTSLPAEEADIVNALWERDFANVRYLAPDDYLETKIGQGRRLLEWRVDRQAMSTGRIDLSPEDLEDVRNRIYAMERGQGPDEAVGRPGLADDLSSPLTLSREAEEKQAIDSLLATNRQISAEDEYLNLIIEVVFLEDRGDQYAGLAEIIRQYRHDLIARRDFARAARLLRSLLELEETLGRSNSEKAAMLAAAVGAVADKPTLTELEESLRQRGDEGDEEAVRYLSLIGPPAARLIGELFERARTSTARGTALEALKKIDSQSPDVLMSLAQESKPGLTREIIALVGESRDRRVVPFLAGFLSYRDASVRLEAVRALGRAQGSSASRILLGFLSDPVESVRIAALENLGGADREAVRQLLDLVGGVAGLKKKSLAEKRAVLSVLRRSRSEDACVWLRQILLKSPFWPSSKHTELRLCAVEALAGLSLPEAREALRMGAQKRQRKVRQACLRALQSPPKAGALPTPGESNE